MSKSVTVEYHAVDRDGCVRYTTPERDLGIRWVKANTRLISGLSLRRVETTVRDTLEYRYRGQVRRPSRPPMPRDDFGIPEYQLAA